MSLLVHWVLQVSNCKHVFCCDSMHILCFMVTRLKYAIYQKWYNIVGQSFWVYGGREDWEFTLKSFKHNITTNLVHSCMMTFWMAWISKPLDWPTIGIATSEKLNHYVKCLGKCSWAVNEYDAYLTHSNKVQRKCKKMICQICWCWKCWKYKL